MAQTTGAQSSAVGAVELSTDGSTWFDISGSTMSVEPGDQNRQTGEAYTVEGLYAIITSGKIEPGELEVKVLYTPTSGEGWARAKTFFESTSGVCFVRWSLPDTLSGSKQYKTNGSKITNLTWPPIISDDAKPRPVGFKVKYSSITESTIA